MATPLLAQQAGTQAFTTADGSFTFLYPGGWFTEVIKAPMDSNGGKVVVNNLSLDKRFDSQDGIMLDISLPTSIVQYSMMGGGKTPAEIVRASVQVGQQLSEISFATASAVGNSTPQPVQLKPSDAPITEFAVNGRPAARAIQTSKNFGIETSVLLVVLDVGSDHLVTVTVTSFKGGLNTIKKYEPVILAIVQTMRYTPPKPVFSGNAELPQVYSGPVGIWQRGYIKFFYPADWYLISLGTQVLQNTPERIQSNALKPGQMQALIQGAAETIAAVNPLEVMNNCNIQKSDWTARKIVQKMLTLTSTQIQQLNDAGVTISQPEIATVSGKEMVSIRQYQGDIELLSIFIDLRGGNVLSMVAYTRRGEMKLFEKKLLAVAGTFEYTPKTCSDDGTPLAPTRTIAH
jgi:hypothetical protein